MAEHADYGLFQVVGVPGADDCTWGVAVWDGECVSYVSPERLRPLDRLARELLRTNYRGPFATREQCDEGRRRRIARTARKTEAA